MNYYIAFSIHGTNCFIRATTTNERLALANPGFTVAHSRRADFQKDRETKIHWDKLNKLDGKPHTSPLWVMRRFKELKELGWVIDDAAFRHKHFSK